MEYGSPEDEIGQYRSFPFGWIAGSELIPKCRAELLTAKRSGDRGKILAAERQLISALAECRHYAEVVQEAGQFATGPVDHPSRQDLRLDDFTVRWSISNRKLDAETLFLQDPAKLMQAYDFMEVTRARLSNSPHIDDGLSSERRIAELALIGPGVLSAAIQDLAPNTISGADRTSYVRLIQDVGGRQDAPILIDTLGLIVSEATKGSRHPFPEQDQADEASEKEIHRCLEKLTGQVNSETDRVARVQFWINWWDKQGAAIIAESMRQ